MSPLLGSLKPRGPSFQTLVYPHLNPLFSTAPLSLQPCSLYPLPALPRPTGRSAWLPRPWCPLSHRENVSFPEPRPFRSHLFTCVTLLFPLGWPEVGRVAWCSYWGRGEDPSDPGTEPRSPALQADSLQSEPQGKPHTDFHQPNNSILSFLRHLHIVFQSG